MSLDVFPTRTIGAIQRFPRADYDTATAAGIAAVIAAGGTLTGAQQEACNTFILGLKANSLWTGFYGLYLFVGGTAGSHAVNWKTPGTYNITWVNSPTHNANGVTGNGTNNYGSTTGLDGTIVPFTCGISIYNRTTNSSATGTTKRLIGNANAGSTNLHMIDYVDNSGIEQNRGFLGAIGAFATDSNPTQKTGLLSINRTTSTNFKGYHNGTQYLTSSVSTSNAPESIPFYIFAVNLGGIASTHAPENFALVAIHDGHGAAQAATFNTLVQALQTALGRNV